MTAMPPLRDILNNTPADAVNVDFNFNTVEAHIGSELINRDGSVPMTGPLTLSGPPTAPAHAVNKQYVDTSAIPVGVIWQFAGGPGVGTGGAATVPAGWAICDGSAQSKTDPIYAALFAVIGTSYNTSGGQADPGSGSFRLPNLGGRIPIGRASGDALVGQLGNAGGSRDLVVPVHNHPASVNLDTNNVDINHSHRYDHGHTAGTDVQGAHTHNLNYAAGMTHLWARFNSSAAANMGGDYSMAAGSGAWPYSGFATPGMTTDGAHGHGVTVNGTGPVNTGYSNNENAANHHHNINGAVTVSNAGVAVANQNLPPYITVNYIIRIG